MSNEAPETASPVVHRCRWAYHSDKLDNPETCSLQFSSKDALRDHILLQHANAEPAIPISCMETWRSESGAWRGKIKPDALGKFVKSLQADSATSHQPMDTDSTTSFSEKPGDDARMTLSTISHPSAVNHTSLDTAHGITRSQELAIVTQVFSPYITSSDEQPRTQPAANSNNSPSSSGRSNPAATQQTPGSNPSHSQSQTHIRNASDDSASLPQSNDYQTVPGILPREISHLVPAPVPAPSSSTATASSSTTTNTSSGGHISSFTQAQRPGLVSPPINHRSVKTTTSTTPLHVGIAFGALPNVSSSIGSGSGGSAAPSPADPLYQVSPENRDTATTGVAVTGFGGGGAAVGLGSPNSSSKKHVDRPLRFGFGRR